MSSVNNLNNMTIRDDFKDYWDGNGLLAPNTVGPGTLIGSGNGVMYASEFYIMLKKLNILTNQDLSDYVSKISQCIDKDLLNRAPVGQDKDQEGPDDYYGVLNCCKQLGITSIPRQFLWAVIKYKGALNNTNPGQWSWRSFLIRQPQLLASMIAASFPSYSNPLHICIRFIAAPLFLISAIILATSCIGVEIGDTDSRRLSWHLWQCTQGISPLCWLAGRLWLNRLYADYGPEPMRKVAGIYYQPHPDNPYSKWWITE